MYNDDRLPPQIRNQLIKFSKNIDLENKHTLLECYKNRIEYGCVYPMEVEKIMDAVHKLCMKKLNLPWWIDFLD